MKNILIAFALIGALVTAPVAAQDYTLGSLKIAQPWARASVTPTGGAYLTIDNAGAADKLLKVESGIATAELHNHIMDGGVMKMRAVEAIDIPAGRTMLTPGGHHIMLVGLKAPLQEGASFPLKLIFEKAGTIEVIVKVDKPGSMGPASAAPVTPPMGDMHKH